MNKIKKRTNKEITDLTDQRRIDIIRDFIAHQLEEAEHQAYVALNVFYSTAVSLILRIQSREIAKKEIAAQIEDAFATANEIEKKMKP
jgi:hypothetical protein